MEIVQQAHASARRSTQDALTGQYDNMLACIRCGLCLSVCPTYQATLLEEESPRGRIAIARALAEGHLPVTPDLRRHEASCLVCEACTAICPTGVRMEEIQIALRSDAPRVSRPPVAGRLALAWVFPRMGLFRAAARLLRFYQRSGIQTAARATGLLRLLGLADADALTPPVPARFLAPRGQAWGQGKPRAALFAGCVMSTLFADTDRRTVDVLVRCGRSVEATDGQGCCGALHAHAGDVARARRLAQRNITAFERSPADAIVVNAAGCGNMLKKYPELFEDDAAWRERARRFSARVRDVTEYLDSLPDRPAPGRMDIRAAYQDACHLASAQRITAAPRRLLQSIPGLELVEMRESALCCGSAGIYNLTQPRMGATLRERKLDCALDTRPDVIVTANPGCLLHMRAGLAERKSGVRVMHIIDLLAEAYEHGGAARQTP